MQSPPSCGGLCFPPMHIDEKGYYTVHAQFQSSRNQTWLLCGTCACSGCQSLHRQRKRRTWFWLCNTNWNEKQGILKKSKPPVFPHVKFSSVSALLFFAARRFLLQAQIITFLLQIFYHLLTEISVVTSCGKERPYIILDFSLSSSLLALRFTHILQG